MEPDNKTTTKHASTTKTSTASKTTTTATGIWVNKSDIQHVPRESPKEHDSTRGFYTNVDACACLYTRYTRRRDAIFLSPAAPPRDETLEHDASRLCRISREPQPFLHVQFNIQGPLPPSTDKRKRTHLEVWFARWCSCRSDPAPKVYNNDPSLNVVGHCEYSKPFRSPATPSKWKKKRDKARCNFVSYTPFESVWMYVRVLLQPPSPTQRER